MERVFYVFVHEREIEDMLTQEEMEDLLLR